MSKQNWETVGGKKGKKKRDADGSSEATKEAELTGAGSQQTMYAQFEAAMEAKDQRAQANASGAAKAPASKDAGKPKPKQSQAPKPASQAAVDPATILQERTEALDAGHLTVVWEEAKGKFPEQPLEWLKALADTLIDALGDAPIGDRDDSPLLFVSKETRSAVVGLLAGCVGEAPNMLAVCLEQAMGLARSNKRPVAGLYLFMQFLLILDASIKASHVVARTCVLLTKSSFRAILPKITGPEAHALLRVLRQVCLYAPHTFILVWKAVMLPILCGQGDEEAKTLAVDCLKPICPASSKALERIVQVVIEGLRGGSPLAVNGAIMKPQEFSVFLRLAFSNDKQCTPEQRQILAAANPVFRELMLRHVIHKTCVPLLLPWAVRLQDTDPLFQQLVRFIVRSLFLDASGYQTVLDALPKEGAMAKLEGLKEAALVVRAVSGGLHQGWPCPEPEALAAFFHECHDRVKALLRNAETREALGPLVETAENLQRDCKTLQAQLQPADESTWPLWLALIISLIIFIVLLAHLACKPGMPLALPPQACTVLNEWGFLGGVERFYEFAAPAVPYVEKAIVVAQPYWVAACEAAAPLVAALQTAAGSAADAAKPTLAAVQQHVADLVAKLRQ